MDSKGQAYSVFKLLIAAVVAGAILLILLQTLQVLPSIGSQNPNSSAANSVKSKINEPGLPQTLENISFNNNDSLNAKTIASQSKALSQEQICVKVSDEVPNAENFEELGEDQVINYKGSFAQNVRLIVMCDRQDELSDSWDSYKYSDTYGIGPDDCGYDGVNGSSKACFVAIIPD